MLDPGDNTLEPPDIAIELEASFANNPKAMCIWNKLKEDEDLKDLLKDFADSDLGLELSIAIDDIPEKPGDNIRGDTSTDEDVTSGLINIKIDSKDMGNSPLELAKSIAHELIHAHILAAIFKQGGMANLANLPGLEERYTSTRKGGEWNHNAAQHDYMAKYYHSRLAQIIKRYDLLNGSNYDIAYYKALAWEGLEGSRYYSTLPSPVPYLPKSDYWSDLSDNIKTISKLEDNCN